ncbi:MAG TPA: M20/M25/M40 family metallo-hydrolase [Gemmatimonadaceae bacterium]|jgi:acetylornithine deacetylase/succinyl-diaminopimelate desuccinylase-like protein|nr:M20/M25/M40 family metallo-hydrolase [Gemmatimonadaceae bacterium]
MPTTPRFALAALFLASTTAIAQLPIPSSNPRVRAALDILKTDNAWTLQQQVELTAIPSPPFKESKRGAEFKKRLEALGLKNIRVDTAGNVIAERRGLGNGPTVVIAGHLDTVFPEGTDVTVKHDGTKLRAPGIGDDDRGLAVVLAVVRAFEKAGVQTLGTVYFVGDVGEEGPGNLRGMRSLFSRDLKGKVDYFISVDDTGLGIASRAVGSYRYRISYKGPGGHSYGAFGIPNPIHALGRAIAGIADIQVPTNPKTTFNVGVIQGGTSVNSISGEASMEVDMRSEDAKSLADVDVKVQRIIRDALNAENARWTGPRAAAAKISLVVDTMGIRPTGGQADSARIVQTALAAGKALGFTSTTGASSTDANIPISLGIPAIRIGGGGNAEGAHSLGEWYDDGPTGYIGPQWAALLVAALAGVHSGVTP